MQGMLRVRSWVLPAVAALGVLAAGCSSIGLTSDKVDYKSVQAVKPLDVPPDLSQLPRSDRYAVPDRPGVASASSAAAPAAAPIAVGGAAVAPAVPNARIERAGDQRWLAVDVPPEAAYAVVKEFWPSIGLAIEREDPAAGIVETVWAENRAKLPQDFFRRSIGRVLEGLYDTGERDRFRMRVERTGSGSEVFIVHRGLVEVATDSTLKDEFRWKARPTDPQLEAEFLTRLMVHLGRDEQQARADAGASGGTAAAATGARARLLSGQPTATLELDAGFDLAWRRVGLALDRSGFTVEDRDRSAGVYFVRYADKGATEDRGFLQRLFGGESSAKADRYRIALTGDRELSRVAVQNAEGGPAPDDVGRRIAGVLIDALE